VAHAKGIQQVINRGAKVMEQPDQNHIHLMAGDAREQRRQAGQPGPTFDSADGAINVDCAARPASVGYTISQVSNPIIDLIWRFGGADVDGGSPVHP
jgi:hypothetical protein